MDDPTKGSGRPVAPRTGADLYADALEVVSRLNSEIAELQRVAPPGYDETIENLRKALLAVREALMRKA